MGLSLAHRGRPHPSVARSTSVVASAEWANRSRPASVLGHDRLTSTATTPSGAAASSSAARRYSSTVRPQIDATTRAPVASSAGRSSASQAATPGPWRPTELIIPAVVSCTRSGGFPATGSACSDFTTTAPSAARSRYGASSAPWPAVPEAVITGLGNLTEPTVTAMSTGVSTARSAAPPAGGGRRWPGSNLTGGSPAAPGGAVAVRARRPVVLLQRPHPEVVLRAVHRALGGGVAAAAVVRHGMRWTLAARRM